ncbi:MAG TPA: glycosyltransferase family 2 protein [Kiritimatiellia bacterium]|jgi:dolichol-phosphate mannosyltransferase|nr:glycosyltransferase family 2 protein [Kiritimatiellia bacterium]HQF19715.1 glycosyltransferase family 2 protein [Kiritimatiellia bacterium]HQG73679.1 glycosyltransferase family 2 protein [Kiritimatiellia bacterium]
MSSPYLVAILTYNNGEDLKNLIARIPREYPYDVVVHVDGSTDGSDAILEKTPYHVLRQADNVGVGRAIRNVFRYASEHHYEAIVILPGNNKNDPTEVGRLLQPIAEGRADYVQGSRYLPGSRHDHTPLFRLVMVKVHALFLSVLLRRHITDALEGFRAIRMSILDDPAICVEQDWLDTYGLETYLFYKVAADPKYRYVEVPVSKIYPVNKRSLLNQRGAKYSHIRPFVDWWHILKPLFYLSFRIKK